MRRHIDFVEGWGGFDCWIVIDDNPLPPRLFIECDVGRRTVVDLITIDELKTRFPFALQLHARVAELLGTGPAIDR
jgi:hypothetical protein